MCVVARRRTVIAALAVFVGALVVQEAFGMIALTQMGEVAAGMDETASVGAVVLALHLRDSGAKVALPTVPRLNGTN